MNLSPCYVVFQAGFPFFDGPNKEWQIFPIMGFQNSQESVPGLKEVADGTIFEFLTPLIKLKLTRPIITE